MRYLKSFIDQETERELLSAIDKREWDSSYKRRVQQYGFEYQYSDRKVGAKQRPIPRDFSSLLDGLVPYFSEKIDQIIVNEYVDEQGIGLHTDSPSFGPVVASLSLGAARPMMFRTDPSLKETSFEIWLEPRSLLILEGPSRHQWQHSIPTRKNDMVAGLKIPRVERRVSMTFRTLANSIHL